MRWLPTGSFWGDEIFSNEIVAMAVQCCECIKNHSVVHFKHLDFMAYELYLSQSNGSYVTGQQQQREQGGLETWRASSQAFWATGFVFFNWKLDLRSRLDILKMVLCETKGPAFSLGNEREGGRLSLWHLKIKLHKYKLMQVNIWLCAWSGRNCWKISGSYECSGVF